MVIGLSREAVLVVPYQPEWETLYEQEAELLRAVLKDNALGVEHIGSTALVGMDAKPIIDLMVAVPNLGDAQALVAEIEALGYEFLPSEPPPDRLFFAKGPRSARTHHLSLAERASDFYTKMVLFRDYLRAYPTTAQNYLELKKELAAKYPNQRPLYTEGKRPFVESVIEAARAVNQPDA